MMLLVGLPACAQSVVISEFAAANATGLRDEDGDFSDWIELYNPDPQPASLLGWYLTDSQQDLTKWVFPDLSVPASGSVVVFASGKDRRDPKAKLHTNFRLDRGGDYLALVRPDGTTIASEFAPSYPRQVTDVAYGRMMQPQTNRWIGPEAVGRLFVPVDNGLGQGWIQPDFNDAAWLPVSGAVGYFRQQDADNPPEPGIPLEDVTRPGDLVVATSANSPGNEGVQNAIDNTSNTKYLNFDKLNAGFTVTPSIGQTIVIGLRLTSANDAPERDPTSFVLSGSNDGLNYAEIARGSVPDFPSRFYTVEVAFTNRVAYGHYRLLFPTVRNAAAAVAMQISEVEFLGQLGDASIGLGDLIRTNVEATLFGHACALLRFPFVVPDLGQVGPLTLRMRYDDGFIAFMNRHEVARANAPATPTYNAVAPTNRFRYAAVQEVQYDLSPYVSWVRTGTNLLAIQAFNDRPDSPDFLLAAQLETVRTVLGGDAYFAAPTPGAPNGQPSLGLVAEVEASPPRGFCQTPFTLVLTCATPGATILYTTNGSIPGVSNGIVYAGPLSIDRNTTLRAAAVRDGWIPAAVATHTYLFLNDVVAQTQASALAAGFPTNWIAQPADYGLDPRVVGPGGVDLYGGKYFRSLKADLQSLPSLSLVMSVDDWFGPNGIYSNPEMRGDGWERAVSVEWLYPDLREGFQADAGIRVQGGAFRRFDLSLKKSFRLLFREKYGHAQLQFPVFGPNATDQFDNLTLRAGANDAWPYGGSAALYARDAFAMETARAMGLVASHSTFVHLYLNGQYWGLYNPVERPDAAFSATYRGGQKEDWDAIGQDSVSNGTAEAWNRMLSLLSLDMSRNENYQRIQGNNPDGTRNPAYENLIDVPNLIDYMILNFYVGNSDWPGRNWWVGRNRVEGDGFHFYPWDTETALGFTGIDADVTGAKDAVARPFAALRTNAEFKVIFADHVYRHFFNDGPLYVNAASPSWNTAHPENNRPAERFLAVAEEVSRAVVGESARWGDQMRTGPFTRDAQWQPERDALIASYFPYRSSNVVNQFRRSGLYPVPDPPVMNQRGGIVDRSFQLTLSAKQGTIYYTTNGTDPRTPITGLPDKALLYSGPITIPDLLTVKTRVQNGKEWSALDEATFAVGTPALAVSELDYQPAPPSAAELAAGYTDANQFEFIELFNPGSGTFDLAGVRFVTGIHFDFTGSAITRLPAGQYVLLVKNRAAFESRYQPGLPIAGEYSGQLDNAGERIQVADKNGVILIDFTYDSKPPWPVAAAGGGASLEVVDPTGNLNLPVNWRASAVMGGSPGKPNLVPAPRLEVLTSSPGQVALRFTARVGMSYTVYYCESLTTAAWQVFQNVAPQPQDQPIEVTLQNLPGTIARFFRVTTP